jgi:hypothetical protein
MAVTVQMQFESAITEMYQDTSHSPQFSGWEVPVHTDSRLM